MDAGENRNLSNVNTSKAMHIKMSTYKTIDVQLEGKVAHLWLNRPERHNALNLELMREVVHFFKTVEADSQVQTVVLRGRGASFCAGADLNWMKQSAALSEADNLAESEELSHFFATVYRSSKLVVSLVHGNCFGGGVGLAAASDLVFTTIDALLSLSEAKLGLAAASITPYLLKRISPSVLKELVFTARHFDGEEASKNGLANSVFETVELAEVHLQQVLAQIANNGPAALVAAKRLINSLTDVEAQQQTLSEIPALLARLRVSPEAREGFAAFLEKRKPNWT